MGHVELGVRGRLSDLCRSVTGFDQCFLGREAEFLFQQDILEPFAF